MPMNWTKVAKALDQEAAQIRQTAQSAFPTDYKVQAEMRTRASLMKSFARALRAGRE